MRSRWLKGAGQLGLAVSLAACGGQHGQEDPVAQPARGGAPGTAGQTPGGGVGGADPSLNGDAGSGALFGGVAGASGDVAPALSKDPWNESSRYVELTCASFHAGSMIFRATREELSARELELLGRIQVQPAGQECAEDGRMCRLAITSDSDEVAEFRADIQDANCQTTEATVGYDALADLARSLPCKYSLTGSPPLEADPRCLHGLFAFSGGSDDHQYIELREAERTYHIELYYCAEATRAEHATLELFGSDSEVPLAVATPVDTPGPDAACLGLEVGLAEPVTAELVLTTSADFLPAGEVFFRFY